LLLSGGVDGAADRMAEQFALNYGAESGRVELIVSGIKSFPQFDKTLNYLGSLDGVKRVTLSSMLGNQSHFSIEVEGGIDAVKQRIALGKRLNYIETAIDTPIDSESSGDVNKVVPRNTLHYRLR